jgi:hypothetical protein
MFDAQTEKLPLLTRCVVRDLEFSMHLLPFFNTPARGRAPSKDIQKSGPKRHAHQKSSEELERVAEAANGSHGDEHGCPP